MLGNVVESAGAERGECGFGVVFSGGTDHDYGTGKLIHDAAQSPQPVEPGHSDIKSDHIRVETGDLFQGIGRTTGGGGDFEIGFRRNHAGEGGAHEGAVIDDEDAHMALGLRVCAHLR